MKKIEDPILWQGAKGYKEEFFDGFTMDQIRNGFREVADFAKAGKTIYTNAFFTESMEMGEDSGGMISHAGTMALRYLVATRQAEVEQVGNIDEASSFEVILHPDIRGT